MSDRHFGGFSRNACGRAAGRNREAAFSVERDQPPARRVLRDPPYGDQSRERSLIRQERCTGFVLDLANLSAPERTYEDGAMGCSGLSAPVLADLQNR